MTTTMLSDAAGLYNSLYEDTMLVARDATLMVQLVTQYSGDGYAPRLFPQYAQSTAVAVADGADYVTGTVFSKSNLATFTPGEVIAQFILTDQAMSTDPDGAMNKAAQELGLGMAEKIDSDLLAHFSSFAGTKGTAGSALTITNVGAAIALLRKNKARGEIAVVLHDYGWHDIWVALGQPVVTAAFLGELANEALRNYGVGRMLGGTFYTDNNISIDASDDAIGAVFVRDAIGFDTRKAITLEPQRDASKRATEINLTAGYASGVVHTDHGVQLLHDATEPV